MTAVDRVSSRTRAVVLLVSALVGLSALTGPAVALVHIDFEQPYYAHAEMQVWDFCLVLDDGVYHIFYLGVPESNPTPMASDDIWHATSPDLEHWTSPASVLSVSEATYESGAVWAPDVIRDPISGLWWMAYTAVDDQANQRICTAWSSDLTTWNKSELNPVIEPDPATFFYYPLGGWAECRDPFLYREDDRWHMLVSAKIPGIPEGRGVVAHSTSLDMVNWSPLDVFLVNDGNTPTNTPESSQYIVRKGIHHVFCLESGATGLYHLAADDPRDLSFNNLSIIDYGLAPEVDSFDGGMNWIFARMGPYQEPDRSVLSFVIRIDTLQFQSGLDAPSIDMAPPLARDFAEYSGNMCLGNPCFGDNPARRGEEPAGVQGNFFFGSREYYPGPLSGIGNPGTMLGETAMGFMNTEEFVIEGDKISMLVGGTNNPEECFVALMDAQTDTVLARAHGLGSETMTLHQWGVRSLQGRRVYIRIEDSDPYGHINVDEIIEVIDPTTSVDGPSGTTPDLLTDLGPFPNPFNPTTRLRFALTADAECRIRIHDLRGRLIWDSGSISGQAGINTVTWSGCDGGGKQAPGGVYVYRLLAGGRSAASGKLTLAP